MGGQMQFLDQTQYKPAAGVGLPSYAGGSPAMHWMPCLCYPRAYTGFRKSIRTRQLKPLVYPAFIAMAPTGREAYVVGQLFDMMVRTDNAFADPVKGGYGKFLPEREALIVWNNYQWRLLIDSAGLEGAGASVWIRVSDELSES
jgi:hypothetical protein